MFAAPKPAVNPADIEAKKLVDKAVLRLQLDNAFYGNLVAICDRKFTRRIKSIENDGAVFLINPDYINKLKNVEEVKGVLALHGLTNGLGHPFRIDGRDLATYNEASQQVVGGIIKQDGLHLPEGFEVQERFQGMAVEQVCAILKREKEEAEKQAQEEESQDDNQETQDCATGDPDSSDDNSDSEPDNNDESNEDDAENDEVDEDSEDERDESNDNESDDGSDNDDGDSEEEGDDTEETDENTDGEDDDDCESEEDFGENDSDLGHFVEANQNIEEGKEGDEPTQPRTEADWMVAMQEALMRAKNAGCCPGGLEQLIEQQQETETPWFEKLARFVVQMQPYGNTWKRPNKRFIHQKTYFPGKRRDTMPPIIIVVDSSASVDTEMLTTFAAEINTIVQSCNPQYVRVIYCDTQVQGTELFFPGDEVVLNVLGRGGTVFQPAFDFVTENEQTPSVLLYLTDMEASWPEPPEYPVMWVTTEAVDIEPPFGEVIKVSNFVHQAA